MYETYRDNLLGYAHVMEGKFKMEDYINAINIVAIRLWSASNIDAYVKSFPDKYQAMLSAKVRTSRKIYLPL